MGSRDKGGIYMNPNNAWWLTAIAAVGWYTLTALFIQIKRKREEWRELLENIKGVKNA
jgi:hypothetical protein